MFFMLKFRIEKIQEKLIFLLIDLPILSSIFVWLYFITEESGLKLNNN